MSDDQKCITMINSDHNKSKKEALEVFSIPAIATLGGLRVFISQADLSDQEKATIRSAIKRADELVGHGALDLAADPARIMAKVDGFSPAMAGMSVNAFANLKSRLRKAFRLAQPSLMAARPRPKLNADWGTLQALCDVNERRNLSRFFHFASGRDWSMHEISDGHIERFEVHLREETLVVRWDDVVRQTIRSWNRLSDKVGDGALERLSPPSPKRTPYWIDPASLPDSLQADLGTFLEQMSKPALFGGAHARKLKPKTIEQYRHCIVTLVSAVAHSGVELVTLTRLAAVVTPVNVERVLWFLHERAGERVTRHMLTVAVRARNIARWCKLPPTELSELDSLVADVKIELPANRRMTDKNRGLVNRLDDQRFRDLVLLAPFLLLQRAMATKNLAWAASLARTAIAIELLLACGMRRKNLVQLELDKSIRKIGEGGNAYWLIEVPEHQVKNNEPLRYNLPPESAKLLETYLREWRPLLGPPSSWLFPNSKGKQIDGRVMTEAIRRATERILGVAITTHQFRHIGAEIFLRSHPDRWSVVSDHLGHRDPNTVRRFYALPKQREASRQYQQRVMLDRSQAAQRLGRRGRLQDERQHSKEPLE